MSVEQTSGRVRSLLRALNIFGLSHLDTVILAALADERPLLLIGPPGTAKSELLNRIATSLSLEHRHYNASLISFDDLLGYPVPNEARDGVVYLPTPGDLWQAESVFLDEISRCRPELQNKLFSVIHERRIQGLALERLRYRWSAMNPPADPITGEDDEEPVCVGSLPLDPALADRFPWVVEIPGIEDFSGDERRSLLARGGEPPAGDAGLPQLVEDAKANLARIPPETCEWAVAWVDALIVPLREARLGISGRRAVALVQSVRSLCAAATALGRDEPLEDLALLALKWGLPQRASGRTIDEAKLAAIHRMAVKTAGEPPTSPWRRIFEERDPVRRLALALQCPPETVGPLDLAQLAEDAWAACTRTERYALSWAIAPLLARCDRFTVPTCERLSRPSGDVLSFQLANRNRPRSLQGGRLPNRARKVISGLYADEDPDARALADLLRTLYAKVSEDFDPAELIRKAKAWRALFDQVPAGEVTAG